MAEAGNAAAAAGAADAVDPGTAAAAAAAAAAGTGEGAGAAGGSWMDGLAPEVREHPAVAKYGGDAGALAKGLIEAQDLIGRKGVVRPRDDAGAEAWGKFHNEMGRPETADGYDLTAFKPPEGLPWNAEIQTGMMGVLHEAGVSQAAAVKIFEGYAGLQKTAWDGYLGETGKAADKAEAALKTEWGDDFDAKDDLANRAAAASFGPNLEEAKKIKLEDGSYLLDNKLIVKAFAAVGETWREDGPLIGGGGGPGAYPAGPAGAKAEIAKIYAEASGDAKHPYNDPKHAEHKALHQKVLALNEIVHGKAAVT